MCSEGYISQADFLSLSQTDCLVHVTTLKVFWFVCAGVNILACLLDVRAFYGTLRRVKEVHSSTIPTNQNKTISSSSSVVNPKETTVVTTITVVGETSKNNSTRMKSPKMESANENRYSTKKQASFESTPEVNKQKLSVLNNRMLIICFAFMASLLLSILSVLKGMNLTTKNIGTDWTATLLFVFASYFFWGFTTTSCLFLLRLVLANAKMKTSEWRHRIELMRNRIFPTIIVTGSLCVSLTFLMFIDPYNQTLFHACSALYWIINGFVFLGLGVALIKVIFDPLSRDLEKALELNLNGNHNLINEQATQKQNELNKILKRTKLVTQTIKSSAISNVPGFFLVGAVPFLLYYSTYFLAVSEASIGILNLVIVNLLLL